MAYFTILPDDTTGTNEWTNFGAVLHEECVQTDDDDTTYVYETRQGHEITFTMADPSVAEGGIDFGETVTVTPYITAHYEGGSGTVEMTIQITGTGITLANAIVNVAVDSSYPTYSGNASIIKSFGTVWDYAGLQNCQMKLDCTGRPDRFSNLRVSYVFIRVDYTAAAVSADNATFFGANF
jgi:hypothetical protein